ncbi:MAG: hypothetical protein QM784_14550 [Polyangiaceae bacterium]
MKLGPIAMLLLGLTGASGCGYRPAYGGARPSGRLTVVAAPTRVPEGGALAALLSGLRGELSRAGVLGPGSGYPRVVVEFVRLDERGAGPQVQRELTSASWALARGTVVGVTARAWIEEGPSLVVRDTGDVRRTTSYDAPGLGSASQTTMEVTSREAAIESAATATGAALGRRVLGEIEVTQEPL